MQQRDVKNPNCINKRPALIPIVGIGAAEGRHWWARSVAGATMSFLNFSIKQPYGHD